MLNCCFYFSSCVSIDVETAPHHFNWSFHGNRNFFQYLLSSWNDKKYIRTWSNSWINWRLIQSVYFFCGMWAVKGNWVQTSCEINLRTMWIWITVWMVKCILIAKWSVIQMVIWKLDYFSQLLECAAIHVLDAEN